MYINRNLEKKIQQNINNDLVLLILGARQTGKTRLLYYILQKLREGQQSCIFINLEDFDIKNKLDEHPFNIFKLTGANPQKKTFFIIDEIQYLKNPSNFLKLLYDTYKNNIKLIVSGSSSFYIDRKFKDSLAGRKRIFNLYTLSFYEFIAFKQNLEILSQWPNFSSIYQREIERLFSEYLTFGGYPAVVLAENIEEKKLLLSELANDYIKKDIFEANIQDQEKYYFMLKILANQVGNLVNKNELASTLGVSTTAIEKYLYTMQKSFHVATIRPFWNNIRKEITKMPKVYFYDLGLRNHFVNNFELIEKRLDRGKCFENAVFREMLFLYSIDQIRFWRNQNKNEVDFIVNGKEALETKFSKKDCKLNKYKVFQGLYPEISFDFLIYENLLRYTLELSSR